MTAADPEPPPIAVLASGRGSNLEALLEARGAGHAAIDIVLVAGDKAEARALRLAEAHGIPTLALNPSGFASRAAYDRELLSRVAVSGARLIVLAGFMRILDGDAIAPWHGRIINIHPSLLPKYRGLNTHRRALQAGDCDHGASVHFVTAELDGGPLIAQVHLAIHEGDDDEDSLAARLLPLEHRLLTAVVAALGADRIACVPGGVCFDGQAQTAPLELDATGFGLHSAARPQAGSA